MFWLAVLLAFGLLMIAAPIWFIAWVIGRVVSHWFDRP